MAKIRRDSCFASKIEQALWILTELCLELLDTELLKVRVVDVPDRTVDFSRAARAEPLDQEEIVIVRRLLHASRFSPQHFAELRVGLTHLPKHGVETSLVLGRN